ncbi:hypothetical protein O6H91_23G004300 [Diphasiastrum complanatum]|uniref:Uncharacterized protein n=1 Tax=Diphasiastrum complanatum TaxID=34168 RepID=A0ACC2A7U5_DIPCM|nr:hypothetical protein O6H91_23G004300 [Diphasiastrum complanatum]
MSTLHLICSLPWCAAVLVRSLVPSIEAELLTSGSMSVEVVRAPLHTKALNRFAHSGGPLDLCQICYVFLRDSSREVIIVVHRFSASNLHQKEPKTVTKNSYFISPSA